MRSWSPAARWCCVKVLRRTRCAGRACALRHLDTGGDPYLIDLLDVQGVLRADLPDLRLVTQAGGALPAHRVRDIAQRGQAHGWSLAVMYGQTEATARMAVLPPAYATRHPDAVGWPVAGSSFSLDTTVPEATGGPDPVGELVFSGPGVMLGYAESPDDLALGRMQDELRTGDLARISDDGLVRIVGRRTDWTKVMGIRIDLGQVQRRLRDAGWETCVTGADQQLQVTYRADDRRDAARVVDVASTVSGLGPQRHLGGGGRGAAAAQQRQDRPACAARHRTPPTRPIRERPGREPADLASVVAALGPLVGRESVNPDRSFVELGGDSFSHVQASLRLGRLLGDLPVDWHHRPLRELPQLAQRQPPGPRATGGDKRAPPRAGRDHDLRQPRRTVPAGRGAHVLLAVAGFNWPIFAHRRVDGGALAAHRPVGCRHRGSHRAGRAHHGGGLRERPLVQRRAAALGRTPDGRQHLLVRRSAADPDAGHYGPARSPAPNAYATRPVAGRVPRDGRAARPAVPGRRPVRGSVRGMPWTVGWLFTAGLAMATARTRSRKLLTVTVALVATIGFFPAAERNLLIMAGLALLALVPVVVVPQLAVRPIGVLAAASLHVYLVQFQMFGFFPSPALKFAAGILAGLAFWLLTTGLLRRLQQLVPLIATSRPSVARHASNRKEDLCVDALS